jgi:hypothetical protein
MAMAGPFYPIWFFILGRRLRQLGGSTRPSAGIRGLRLTGYL